MQHHRDLKSIQLEASLLTIGSFDGVHLGHQSILTKLVDAAREKNIPSVVLTFYPHPSVVLRGRRPSFYITSSDDKAMLLGEHGVDHVITMKFDHTLASMKALEFLRQIKMHLHFQGLWVGENFALGQKREGNIRYLEDVKNEIQYELHVVPPVFVDGEILSSTRVREALRAGDVARVKVYLGKPFLLNGVVEQGRGRGKELGFPTANLSVWDELAYPGAGVYACLAKVQDVEYRAVVNIGVRPTFNDGLEIPLIEAHLLNFSGDLYAEQIKLTFIERLRDERRFSGPDELIGQIQRDIHRAEIILD